MDCPLQSLGNAIDPMHLIEGASPAVLEESVEKAGLQEEEKRKAIQFMQRYDQVSVASR